MAGQNRLQKLQGKVEQGAAKSKLNTFGELRHKFWANGTISAERHCRARAPSAVALCVEAGYWQQDSNY